ncbi:23S rRNA (pseudouridine(1915)-N(3))-methyltransferase RlmH [Acidipila sp. EB88]|uniref:23S rRNA (pseudouridine(1915)-N(3))-methyltransferase RlmH n=1 Tax=Acidipila sp. EB88 TaxID=2305226 RepID=UPI000F5D6A37|nr:23S rRNA (pseudouridine(1915)-N(3))-methyltransferase RlmH [Acidipila sp. EB88]RRA48193.1 23S rRNA (pseudouridine(1915)-N(3))-methyltransferase RlmH [Acidipila sp. EB88]
MRLQLASIAPRPGTGPAQQLLDQYLERTAPYLPIEAPVFRSEAALLDALARARGRTNPVTVLLDPRGRQLASEQLAALLDTHKLHSTQLLVFAIGPADGWSETTRKAAQGGAHTLLSLGPMTLPHELARVVLAEQLYRACTILAGHPYHGGH